MIFEWDNKKEAINLSKHGITFSEASTVFQDKHSLEKPDILTSTEEERWIRLGKSDKGNILVVIYCERIESIRIISARLATKKERIRYILRGVYER